MADPDDVTTASERSAYAKPDQPPSEAPAGTETSGADPGPATATAPEAPVAASDMAPAPDAAAPSAAPPTPPSPPPPATPAEGSSLLESLPIWLVPAILVAVPVLFGLAVQVEPSLYDDVVWKYYWGPIKADAENVGSLTHDGVVAHSGYNLVNTASWALLLGVSILGIAQMLVRFRTPMDDKLILGATAWVVVGSAEYVLEDAGLFQGWLQYLFITPPIYLLFGAFGILSFLTGQWMKKVEAVGGPHAALRLLWILHAMLVLVWTGLWMKDWPHIVVYVNPLWVAGFAVVNFAVARHFVLKKGVDPSQLTLLLSLGTYLLVGAYIVTYVVDPWNDFAGDALPSSALTSPLLALAATVLVLALAKKAPKALLGILLVGGSVLGGIVLVVLYNLLVMRLGLPVPRVGGLLALAIALALGAALAIRTYGKNKGKGEGLVAQAAVAYALAINLLIVFSQMVDAFATSIGIDLHGYSEKHVLSARVIDVTREFGQDVGSAFIANYPTFLGFAPVKFLVSLGVIYAIDVQSRDDAGRYPTVIGLVKFAIIMVGIGPGVRDFTRLSLGV